MTTSQVVPHQLPGSHLLQLAIAGMTAVSQAALMAKVLPGKRPRPASLP